MSLKQECPVCRRSAKQDFLHINISGPPPASLPAHKVACPRCSEYRIEHIAARILESGEYNLLQRANAAGWIHANAREDLLICESDGEWLMNLQTPTVGEKAVKLLRHLAKSYPIAGQLFRVPIQEEVLAICWATSSDELIYLATEVLGRHHSYLMPDGHGQPTLATSISPKGHNFLDHLSRSSGESSPYGFVAMRFNDSTARLRENGIKPAIAAAGYRTTLIDEVEHLEHIDDQILAAIRRCRFLVADLTDQRQNVYYEAGFAQGLGSPVIWTCRQSEIDDKRLHFDVRQYACIGWEEDGLEGFQRRLRNRIVSTIGPGPLLTPAS